MIADDLGWNDVGYHGSDIATPQIDKLVQMGVELNQFYVQPTCTPTRSALMTGRYPMRYGMHARVSRAWHSRGLPLSERLLSEALQDLGYATAICGKWHLGMSHTSYLPFSRGFDHQYGHLGGSIDYFRHTDRQSLDWHRNQRPLSEAGYSTELIANEAVRLIQSHDDDQPMFLYVAFNAPHAPQQAPVEAIEKHAHIGDERRRTYSAMVSCLDDAVGRVLNAVDERGWTEHTFILFLSDNGGATNTAASNHPLRGHKGQLYEGGVRVPAAAFWKGVLLPGLRVDAPLHAVDVFPTLIRLAGGEIFNTRPLDGRDVWPAISQGDSLGERPILLNIRRKRGAVRKGDWKLVRNGESNAQPPTIELFNLRDDPVEENNLSADHPDKTRELVSLLDEMALFERDPQGLEPVAPEGFEAPDVWDFERSETGGATRPPTE